MTTMVIIIVPRRKFSEKAKQSKKIPPIIQRAKLLNLPNELVILDSLELVTSKVYSVLELLESLTWRE